MAAGTDRKGTADNFSPISSVAYIFCDINALDVTAYLLLEESNLLDTFWNDILTRMYISFTRTVQSAK